MAMVQDNTMLQTQQGTAAMVSVLVVDDDIPILEAVADMLQLHGYNVLTASDGLAGLAILREFRPDLIISDIMMPEMDGYQFFETVRRNPEWVMIPFMFLTAKGQKKDVTHGYTIGADDFIVKPFETDDLLVKVGLRIKRARDIRAAAQNSVDMMKEQLLTIFGHELRTPLTYIYGYANLLEESPGSLDEETVSQMIAGIHLGANRLMRLTESLLMLVRIDSGTIGTEIAHRSSEVNLGAVVRAALASLQEAFTTNGVSVELDVPESLAVWGVEYLLNDAVVRVLDNAQHYRRSEGGHILVEAHVEDTLAVLKIVDDGIGIAPENHERVFERFEQVDRAQMEQQGIGLGLTIARSLLREHGGDIQVTSQLAEGSAFQLTIPIAKPTVA